MSAQPIEKEISRLIPVPQWNKYHEWPPQGGLRHLIFHEHKNGFHKCVKRVGRRVLIDEQEFFKWVTEQSGNKCRVDTNA